MYKYVVFIIGLVMCVGCAQKQVDDLSSPEFKWKICEDDTQVYNCRPRIVEAIDKNDLRTVAKIIESGFDPNTPFPVYYGTTSFMHAVRSGKIEIAEYLLDHGADPSLRIPIDPIQTAKEKGFEDLAVKMKDMLKESEGE